MLWLSSVYVNVVLFLNTRYEVDTPDGSLETYAEAPTGWTHTVLNYIRPNNGIRIYHDGDEKGSDDTKSGGTNPPGDGRVVVGRFYTDLDTSYGGVDVDELLFFNEMLSVQKIMNIRNII